MLDADEPYENFIHKFATFVLLNPRGVIATEDRGQNQERIMRDAQEKADKLVERSVYN